ncbi:MAG TPA: hypothetical protein PKY81_15430 [bacterium]|nr:hypothetical protein [bacterium]
MSQFSNDDFFGLYLYNKGYVTYSLLIKATLMQKQLNKKIGDWAIELGYLTREQVNIIYNEQKRTNNYFGEIAIKKGLLSEKTVQNIMQIQKESHTFIGEIFQLLGYITESQLKKELEEYDRIEEERIKEVNSFMKANVEKFPYLDLILDAAEHTFYRMMLMSLKVGKEVQISNKIQKQDDIYRVTFSGDYNFSIFYNYSKVFSDDMVFNFFSTYPKKKVISMRDSILQELSNIVSGVIATDLSNLKDISVNISIPHKINDNEIGFDSNLLRVPLVSPDGIVELNFMKN